MAPKIRATAVPFRNRAFAGERREAQPAPREYSAAPGFFLSEARRAPEFRLNFDGMSFAVAIVTGGMP